LSWLFTWYTKVDAIVQINKWNVIEIMTTYDNLTFKEKIKFRKRLLAEEGLKQFARNIKDYKDGWRCVKCGWTSHVCTCEE